jgi:hypothetical protein
VAVPAGGREGSALRFPGAGGGALFGARRTGRTRGASLGPSPGGDGDEGQGREEGRASTPLRRRQDTFVGNAFLLVNYISRGYRLRRDVGRRGSLHRREEKSGSHARLESFRHLGRFFPRPRTTNRERRWSGENTAALRLHSLINMQIRRGLREVVAAGGVAPGRGDEAGGGGR